MSKKSSSPSALKQIKKVSTTKMSFYTNTGNIYSFSGKLDFLGKFFYEDILTNHDVMAGTG